MKHVFGIIAAVGLAVTTIGVHALSFGPDTIFLEADSQTSCEAMGGHYTEWYEETYCTTTASAELTTVEQVKISIVVNKIVKLIEADTSLYTEVMKMLDTYKTKFMEANNTKKLAIATLLMHEIEAEVNIVPDSCSVWFDGCNTCQIGEDGEMACTKMFCEEKEMPYCMDHEDETSEIPDTCSVWFDGCNTCQVGEDGEVACTKMFCPEDMQEEPTCKVHEKIIVVADQRAECTGVGSMECLLTQESTQRSVPYMKLGDIKGEAKASEIHDDDCNGSDNNGETCRNYFYGNIEGFEYISGYQWTLLVEETHLDPAEVPADSSSIQWELKEVLDIQAEVPDTCESRYDGCNTCSVGEDGMMACTLMACPGEPMMPYCMDDEFSTTTAVQEATDYNSSRSNKSTSY